MTVKRSCLSCGRLIVGASRCVPCARAHKPSPTRRGYGSEHRQARALLAATLPAPCGYGCGTTVTRESFVAAHVVDGQPAHGWIASCVTCNQRARVHDGGGAGSRRDSDEPRSTHRPSSREIPA